jgi:osmotically-inducible protein OsmY
MKTDDELRQEVTRELTWDPCVECPDLAVEAQAGVVTLRGSVGMYTEAVAAEQAALRITGVVAVVNRLEVQPPEGSQPEDEEIAQAVRRELQFRAARECAGVQCAVAGCWVTLTGQVSTWDEHDRVLRVVRHVAGVRGVTDRLTVQAPRSSTRTPEAAPTAGRARRRRPPGWHS